MNIDGHHVRICKGVLPDEATDTHEAVLAFAKLCGAASLPAFRLNDEMDLGAALSSEERTLWRLTGEVLLRMADYHTFGHETMPVDLMEAVAAWAEAFHVGNEREEAK
jgi:hypothetical protein